MTLNDEVNRLNLDFPTTKHEDWLYYDLDRLKTIPVQVTKSPSTTDVKTGFYIHFFNGELDSFNLSNNQEPSITTVDNSSNSIDGLSSEKNYTINFDGVTESINIINEVSNDSYQAVGLTININNCKLTLNRTFITPNNSLQITATTINVSGDSNVYLTDTNRRNTGQLLDTVYANINSNSIYHTYNESILSSNSRFEQNVKINSKNGFARLHGFSINPENGETFYNTHVYHHAEETESHQLFKSLNLDDALFEYNGKVTVAKNAQQINSYQLNQNIVLNQSATIHSRPQLFIDADDVKCSHGSTTGDINREQLLYLKSRGLDDIEAKRAILFAFLADVLSIEGITPDRDYLRQIFDEII